MIGMLPNAPQRLIYLAAAAAMIWGAYRSYKTGKVSYRSLVIAERLSDPVMFWIYVGSGAALGLAAAVAAII